MQWYKLGGGVEILHHDTNHPNNPDKWTPTWRTHVIAISIGAVAFVLSVASPHGYGWGGAVAAAGAALIFPSLIYYSKFNDHRLFWSAVTVLSITQVPFVIGIRHWIEQFRFPFMVLFGTLDCLFVIVAFWYFLRRE